MVDWFQSGSAKDLSNLPAGSSVSSRKCFVGTIGGTSPILFKPEPSSMVKPEHARAYEKYH